MKIRQIEFSKIGPFEKTSLDFSQGNPGLHIIYGSNEAGKSSALRYFNYFLFGIPTKNEEDFAYDYQEFAIRASLQTEKHEVELTRFKRNKEREILLKDGSNGREILEKLTDSMTREEFERLFGINHPQIRHGAHDLLTGKGDLSKTLFEAGSGIHDLAKIQNLLEESIESKFSSRKSGKPINILADEFQSLKKQINQEKIDNDKWNELSDTHKNLLEHEMDVSKKIIDLRARQAHNQKIIRVLPNITKRKNCIEKLIPLDHLPLVEETKLIHYEDSSKKLDIQHNNIKILEKQIQSLQEKTSTLEIKPELLAQSKEIEALNQSLGQLDSLQKDLPKRLAEKDTAESEAKRIARDLYNHENLDQVVGLLPNLATRQEIQELAFLMEELDKQLLELRKKEATGKEAILAMDKNLNNLNPHQALEKIEVLAGTIKTENLIPMVFKSFQQSILSTKKGLETKFQRLSPWDNGLDNLLRAKLPSQQRIRDFSGKFNALEKSCNDLVQSRQVKQNELKEKKHQVENLQPTVKLPTIEDLEAVRRNRQQAWKHLEQGGASAGSNELSELKTRYLALVDQVDLIADRIISDAERIGTIKQLNNDIRTLEHEIQLVESHLAECVKQRQDLETEWKTLWNEAGLSSPGSPAEMIAWLVKVEEWIGEYQLFQPQLDDLQEREKRQQELFGKLNNLVAQKFESLETTWVHLEQFLAKEAAKNVDRKHLLGLILKERENLAATQAELAQVLEAKNSKEILWMKRLTDLKISPDSASSKVRKYLSDIENIKSQSETAKERKDRAEKIRHDIGLIQNRLRNVLGALHYDHLSSEIDSIRNTVEQLARDLEKAKTNQKLTKDHESEKSRLNSDLGQAEKECAKHTGELENLGRMLGNISANEVAQFFDRLRMKWAVSRELEEVESFIIQDAAGESLDAFCKTMEVHDAFLIQKESAELDEEISKLEENKSNLLQQIGGKKKELESLESKPGAFQLASEIEMKKAKCHGLCKEMAASVLAKVILDEASRIYREQNEDPILAKARIYFKTLTLENFVDITPSLSENIHILQVERKDGRILDFTSRHISPKDGNNTVLSDGTADQLFLSLRLAAIENHLGQIKDPLPIILDDILIQYDDERSVAALDCLAKLSEKTQVIMFTHHKHLGNLIEKCRHRDKIFFQEMKQQL